MLAKFPNGDEIVEQDDETEPASVNEINERWIEAKQEIDKRFLISIHCRQCIVI